MYIHKTYACYIKKLYIKQLMRKCLQAAEDFEDMPELGFGDRRSVSSGFTARDASPDSVIFTADSNFSIFSSTSGSVERCSSASDVLDHDSLASQFSHHLAGHEYRESSSSGPDLDPNKVTTLVYKTGHVSRKEKVKVRKGDNSEAETEDENFFLDSARSSFSQALKECQDRRSRSEALLKNQDRRRPASLDLNGTVINVAHSSSPRFGVVKKTSVMARQTGIFPSPGTPNYRHAGVGIQKGWSSERVPLHTNANRRHVNTALLPYNNGRALPSKWEDAERWIFSPVSGDGNMRHSFQQQQRRPKSKSGPLGPPGVAYYSMYSPAAPTLEGGNAGTIIANSPFSAGMMEADGLSITYAAHGGSGNLSGRPEPCMGRSISIHGYSELVSQSSLIGPQEEKVDVDGIRDAAANVSRAVSRRDMATQMSPEGSPCSSAGRRSSCSTSTPSILPIVELPSFLSSKSVVRDVQVDERVTITRWSKKNKALLQARGSGNVDDWKKKALEIRPTWEVPETAKSVTKVKREEARITAWENLQKAKAEAAIRKLEMKLEKKRSSSMDKIMKKLRSAQKKAQEMRSSVLANQAHQVSGNSHKAISFRRTRQMGSLSGCFTCHAF